MQKSTAMTAQIFSKTVAVVAVPVAVKKSTATMINAHSARLSWHLVAVVAVVLTSRRISEMFVWVLLLVMVMRSVSINSEELLLLLPTRLKALIRLCFLW